MAGNSVGGIELDLTVNQKKFEKQMHGITGLAKKAGVALAAAFAVKKVVDFGASCVKLGSNLAEVQNVVDVTFPKMSKQVDAFAKNAATSFGLSETMAKKFTGTFGAMSKSFGFSEGAALEMSTTLTGLSGDVASFYNLSQDEAFTKLKSVFTGETESLKDLGVVMTQTALDQYALANGFGKTTKSMTEAEKVALRYQFVQEKLSGASGDFARTSDGWANQVRILKLQMDSLKATLGQGLINVLTPVIKVINTIIGKLMSLANAFKSFTELITGKKNESVNPDTSGMDAVADSANSASGAVAGTGDAAKKAAKEIKNATTGIDELNIIDPKTSSGSGDSGSDGEYGSEDFDMGELDTSGLDEMDSKYQGLIDRAKELVSIFKGGFWDGVGNTTVFEDIGKSISGIKESLSNIFTDTNVLNAANNLANSISYSFGQCVGAITSIGASLASNLLGGINAYLSENSGVIKGFLVSMFDVASNLSGIFGNYFTALSTVFEAFQSADAIKITSGLIGIFTNCFMGTIELWAQFGVDLLDVLTTPFIENADGFKVALENTFSVIEPIVTSVKELVDEIFTKLKTTYDNHVAPMLESFKKGFSEITTKLLEAYNKHILPTIKEFGERFAEFKDERLSPLIDKFMEFVGRVTDGITTLWEELLKPFVMWFIETMGPVIGKVISWLSGDFLNFFKVVAEVAGHILDSLGGLIDFLVCAFTLDWENAWSGLKNFFFGICDAVKTILSSCVGNIKNIIFTGINWVKEKWENIWGSVKDFFFGIWENIKNTVSTILGSVQTFISTTITNIKDGFTEKLDAIKEKWGEIWDSIKSTVEKVFGGTWDFIKGIINSILGGIESMANGVVKGVNKVIETLNNLSFDIPDWIPGIGGNTFGFNIPKMESVIIPKLAQGGYVKANTPQLAMIGDNRHQGEVVAPEDKLQEMANRAVAMATNGSGLTDTYLVAMVELLKQLIRTIEALDLTVNFDIREIKQKLVDLDKRSGYSLKQL